MHRSALFADGRYLLNLQQYSAGGYRIGNGQLLATYTDPEVPPSKITDAQIRSEIRSLIAAGSVPPADADTIYFVFTPPDTTVTVASGKVSGGYHSYRRSAPGTDFAYAHIAFFTSSDTQPFPGVYTSLMTS